MEKNCIVKSVRVRYTNISQREAAEHLGLSLTAYVRKENDKARFYADELVKLAKLFQVSIDIFFDQGCHNKTHDGGCKVCE